MSTRSGACRVLDDATPLAIIAEREGRRGLRPTQVLNDWSGSFAPGILFVMATVLLTLVLVTLVVAHQRATAAALAEAY